jgi:hypothetical protein
MNERIERQKKMHNLTGQQVRNERETLKSKVQSGQATAQEKRNLRAVNKRAAQMREAVEKRITRR